MVVVESDFQRNPFLNSKKVYYAKIPNESADATIKLFF